MKKLMGLTVLMLLFANIGMLTKANAKDTIAKENCPHLVRAVHFYRNLSWKRQDELGRERLESSYSPKTSCKYTKWVVNLWRTRAKSRKSDLLYFSKVNETWKLSVNLVQKPYPGTRDWLLSCSGGEGGHGPWQWNKPVGHYGHFYLKDYPYKPAGSSGAGGPMQFMRSTYESYAQNAFRLARKRGLSIPPKYNSWYSLLGQAVVAAYIRDKSVYESYVHWNPSIDYKCR